MAKWATNSHLLKEVWKADDLEFKVATEVLGIGWETESDTLSLEPREVTEVHADALQPRGKSYE
jgi:hypothetical protein